MSLEPIDGRMMENTNDPKEREYFLKYLNKNVSITRTINKDKTYFYKGTVIDILATRLILDDKKTGQILFSFDEIDFIEELQVKEGMTDGKKI